MRVNVYMCMYTALSDITSVCYMQFNGSMYVDLPDNFTILIGIVEQIVSHHYF